MGALRSVVCLLSVIGAGCGAYFAGDCPPVESLEVAAGAYVVEGLRDDHRVTVSEDRTEVVETFTFEGKRYEVRYAVERVSLR